MENNNFKKNFGRRVRYLRRLAGLTQEQLSERAGLSSKTISYIEHGKNTLSFNKLPLIAEALNIPVYKLFIFAEEKEENHKDMLNVLLETATNKELNALADITKIILSIG